MLKNIFVFIISTLLMAFFSIFTVFAAEITDVLKLSKTDISVTFAQEGTDTVMSWEPSEYPVVYKIDTFSHTTGLVRGEPEYHHLTTETSKTSRYIVPPAPIPTYYEISAQGFFKELFRADTLAVNPNFPIPPSPVLIFHYPEDAPASLMPFLVWHVVPDAVCYEFELLDAPPEFEGGIEHSTGHHLFSTTQIFTNGYQADLRPYQNYKPLYYRVRALNLKKEPIGEFCHSEKIFLDSSLEMPNCPLINNFDFMSYKRLPIYPVYDWIPINGGYKYEVELLDKPPEIENGVVPNSVSLWRQTTLDKSSCYDEYSRPYAGPYYWRVRALDAEDKPVGTWSDSAKFVVEDFTQGVNTAIFGDSVSHGGGAVSYSPRALEYSYATYLDFPVVNLSRSGDTSKTTLERFETDVLPFHPVNLIVLTGINSLRDASISAEDIISDLTEINRLCLRNKIRPIFITLTPLNPKNIDYVFHTPTDPDWAQKMKTVNNFIKRQAYFINITPYFTDENGELDSNLSIDGIHPDLRGKMLMGEIINQHRRLFKEDTVTNKN